MLNKVLSNNQQKFLEEVNLPLFLLLEAEELNSDDEKDASQDDVNNQDQPSSDQDANEDNVEQEQPSEEDIFNYELQGAEDKFLQFTLYDKLLDLSSKIEILLDNVKNDTSTENIDLIKNLEHYSQYLDVLNELIFSISTSVTYKLIGQIELELINLLEIYNAHLETKAIQNKDED